MTRSLRLRSETLTQLTADELGSVAGANGDISLSCPVVNCVGSQDCVNTYSLRHCVVDPLPTSNCPTLLC